MEEVLDALPELHSYFQKESSDHVYIYKEPVVSICFLEIFKDYELAIMSDDTETYGYAEFNGMKTDVLRANPTPGMDLDQLVNEIRRIYSFPMHLNKE